MLGIGWVVCVEMGIGERVNVFMFITLRFSVWSTGVSCA